MLQYLYEHQIRVGTLNLKPLTVCLTLCTERVDVFECWHLVLIDLQMQPSKDENFFCFLCEVEQSYGNNIHIDVFNMVHSIILRYLTNHWDSETKAARNGDFFLQKKLCQNQMFMFCTKILYYTGLWTIPVPVLGHLFWSTSNVDNSRNV